MSVIRRHFGLLLAAALAVLFAMLVIGLALPVGNAIMLGFVLLFVWAGIWSAVSDHLVRQGRWPAERSPSR